MSVEEQQCNECGASDWNEVLTKSYPERRRDRDQTTETVYDCRSCDAQGKMFEDGQSSSVQYSGALR